MGDSSLRIYGSGRTLIPKRDLSVQPASEVKTYTLSPEELARYQAMPKQEQERAYRTWERSSKWDG